MPYDEIIDQSIPPKGSYGTIFVPLERRQHPDAQKVYLHTIAKAVRATIKSPDPLLDKAYKDVGIRYHVGLDNSLVTEGVLKSNSDIKSSSKKDASSIMTTPQQLSPNSRLTLRPFKNPIDSLYKESQLGSIAESEKRRLTKINQLWRSTETLLASDRRPGGQFHVPLLPNPYDDPFQNIVSTSAYSTTTPKQWPPETQYTKSSSRNQHYDSKVSKMSRAFGNGKDQSASVDLSNHTHPLPSSNACSKSKLASLEKSSSQHSLQESHQGSLTTFQQALVQCGRLTFGDDLIAQKRNQQCDKSTANQQNLLKHHASWLKHRISEQITDYGSISTADDFLSTHENKLFGMPSDLSVISTDSKAKSKRRSNERVALNSHPKDSSVVNTSVKSMHTLNSHKRYESELVDHLNLPNPNISQNPFRPTEKHVMKMFTRTRPPNPTNPTDYKSGVRITNLPNYSICVKPSRMIAANDTPSREEINESLSMISRKTTLSYDTRIVETGALLKALQDMRHPTPGVKAIIDLHRSFIDAAIMNPNPWLLNRRQIAEVVAAKVSWLEKSAIQRLVTAYDPNNCGLIRYIRISVSLVCCSRPALQSLSNLLQKVEAKKEERALKKRQEKEYITQQNKLRAEKEKDKDKSTATVPSRRMFMNADGDLEWEETKDNDNTVVVSTAANDAIKEANDTTSDLDLLLQLIHGLYEDCDGGIQISSDGSTQVKRVGMRLEDIVESLSCCAANIDDELAMQRVAEPLVQQIFELGQREDIIHFNNPNSSILHPDGAIIAPAATTAIGKGSVALGGIDEETVSVLSFDDGRTHLQSHATTTFSGSLKLGGNSLAWDSTTVGTGRTFASLGLTADHESNATAAAIGGRRPNASVVLKHAKLKTLRHLPRVTADVLVQAMKSQPSTTREFSRQLERFRELVSPYLLSGTLTYEKSVIENLSYGTKAASNRSLFQRPDELYYF